MHAVTISEPGGPEALGWAEVPDPVRGPGEVLVDVAATAVNRADLLQRQGFYPPPPGASEILGLECSGVISEVGEGVDRLVGRRRGVRAALRRRLRRAGRRPGRAAAAPPGRRRAGHGGARCPRSTCTVWSNVFMLAELRRGETFLVHGGSSGIGTMAIQLAARAGARVFTTAGTPAKLDVCRELGADVTINYRDEDFVERVQRGDRRPRASTSSSTTWARSTWTATSTPWPSAAGWSSSACRAAPRPSWTSACCCAKRASVHATTLAARPATGHGGKAEIVDGGAARRLARRRARHRSARSSTAGCRCPGPPRRTASSRPASTSARSCSSTS